MNDWCCNIWPIVKATISNWILIVKEIHLDTWGMTPISRRSGPRMNPPPEPRRPPRSLLRCRRVHRTQCALQSTGSWPRIWLRCYRCTSSSCALCTISLLHIQIQTLRLGTVEKPDLRHGKIHSGKWWWCISVGKWFGLFFMYLQAEEHPVPCTTNC